MSEKLGGISVFFLTHNSLLPIQMVCFGVRGGTRSAAQAPGFKRWWPGFCLKDPWSPLEDKGSLTLPHL